MELNGTEELKQYVKTDVFKLGTVKSTDVIEYSFDFLGNANDDIEYLEKSCGCTEAIFKDGQIKGHLDISKSGKIELLIDVDDSGWYNEYYRKAEEYKGVIDMPGVTHTSSEIEISVLFTPKGDQSKDILETLGYNGEFIKGPGVDDSGNFNTYRVSTSLAIPFQK